MSQEFCYEVECDCTNPAKDAVATSDDTHCEYLDCVNGILYVKAGSLAEVQKLVGPNIISVKKLGPCYSE